jgi:hypothetical protein
MVFSSSVTSKVWPRSDNFGDYLDQDFSLGSSGIMGDTFLKSASPRTFTLPQLQIDRPDFTITSARSTGLPRRYHPHGRFVRSAASSGTVTKTTGSASAWWYYLTLVSYTGAMSNRLNAPRALYSSLRFPNAAVTGPEVYQKHCAACHDQTSPAYFPKRASKLSSAHSADAGFRFDDEHRLPAEARGTRGRRHFPGIAGRKPPSGERVLLL